MGPFRTGNLQIGHDRGIYAAAVAALVATHVVCLVLGHDYEFE